jgi:hypothetical protein
MLDAPAPQPRTAERCTCALLEHERWWFGFRDGVVVGILLAAIAELAVLAINRWIG